MGSCRCPSGQTLCNGQCVSLQTSTSNCGACGNACTGGRLCNSGMCACPRLTPDVCNGQCTNLQISNQNCGMCGRQCGNRQQCLFGQCRG